MLLSRHARFLTVLLLAGVNLPTARAAEDPECIHSLLRPEFRRAAKEVVEIADARERAKVLIEIASAQGRVGDRDAGLENLRLARLVLDNAQEAATPEEKDDHFFALIDLTEAFHENKDQVAAQALVLKAVQALEKAEDLPRKAIFLAKIGKFRARIGHREGSKATFLAAIKAVEAEDIQRKVLDLQIIAELQNEAGDRDGAEETIREACRSQGAFGNKDSLIGGWAFLIISQGKIGGAEECLRMIEDAAPGHPPEPRLLGQILHGIGNGDRDPNRLEAERRALDRILRMAKAAKPGAEKSQLIGQIAVAEGHLGNFDEAIRLTNGLDDEFGAPEKIRTWVAIAPLKARAGDKAGARALLRETYAALGGANGPEASWILSEIAEAQIVAEDLEGAARTIDDMRADDVSRCLALAGLAKALARAGKRADARATCLKCTELLNTLGHDEPDILGGLSERMERGAVTVAWVAIGDIDAALKILGKFPAGWDKDEALRAATLNRSEAGDVTEALRFSRMIADEDLKSYTLAGIAQAQAKVGDAEGAFQWVSQLEKLKTRVACLKAAIPPSADEKPKTFAP